MKRQTRKVVLGAVALAAIAGVAQNAYAAKTNLKMSAKIIAAADITATQTLKFGTLTYTAAGTLSVDDTGGTSTTGGVSAIGTNAQEGEFKVKGAKAAALEVTLPTKDTVKNGTKTMKVDKFTISGNAVGPGTPYKITFGATVTKKTDINVGARLTVAGAETTGTYTGTVQLTVGYQ